MCVSATLGGQARGWSEDGEAGLAAARAASPSRGGHAGWRGGRQTAPPSGARPNGALLVQAAASPLEAPLITSPARSSQAATGGGAQGAKAAVRRGRRLCCHRAGVAFRAKPRRVARTQPPMAGAREAPGPQTRVWHRRIAHALLICGAAWPWQGLGARSNCGFLALASRGSTT